MTNSTLQSCYHCSQPCEEGTPFRAELAGQNRYFCCAGCQAIAQTIHGQGLEGFYARRVAMEPPVDGVIDSKVPEALLVYDDLALLNRYAPLLNTESSIRYTTLRLEKIRCAACVWLNEQHWRRVPGVIDVQINYATQRAKIQFDSAKCGLSNVLYAAQQIGYEAWPFDPSANADLAKAEQRRLLFRLGVALLSMMQVMMYAWPTYASNGELTLEQAKLMGWAGWFLTLPVIFYSAAPIFSAAWHSVRMVWLTRTVGMDVPVAIALVLAFIAGTYNLVMGVGETYFDSITMFVAFLLLARYIELRARHSAQGGAEALARQLPATCAMVLAYSSENMQVRITPVARIELGDVIRVSPGDVIPVDADILSDEASVGEALLTGESRPVNKRQGEPVYAGSHNLGSPLFIKATAVGNATRMAGIANLLEEALQTKPYWAGLAEKWASYFVIVLLLLAVGTGLFWQLYGSGDAWVRAVAVLVVSCPCALSLAAPAALAAAQGALAKIGLLVVKGHALEGLANANALVLDKTGTLTTGDLKLVDIQVVNSQLTQQVALSIARKLEVGQAHPVAIALLNAEFDSEQSSIENSFIKESPNYLIGCGVHADGWYLGSSKWIKEIFKVEMPALTAHLGQVILYLAGPQGVAAYFIFEDEAREGVADLIDFAKASNMSVHLISGDDPATVAAWANRFGIPAYRGHMLPEEKLAYVQELQKTNNGKTQVLAVGDGINDAPQLGQADVSVAVGRGAPLAQAGADIILVDSSLSSLARGMAHAKFTKRVIGQNLIWAFIYNVGAIPVAMLGMVNPWIAGIGMSLSSLLVTLNAWRLRKI